jgi:hypothetical protein
MMESDQLTLRRHVKSPLIYFVFKPPVTQLIAGRGFEMGISAKS